MEGSLDPRIQAFLDAAPDPMVVIDAQDRVGYANPGAARLFGYPVQTLVGLPATAILPAPDRPPTEGVRSDGSRFPVEVSLSEVGPLRWAVIRDGTARQAAWQAAGRRAQVRHLDGLGRFAGGVAHDFNNLLAVIANYAAFVGAEVAAVADATVARDVEQIQRAADRGIALTGRLLEFAGHEVPRLRAVSVDALVDGLTARLAEVLGEGVSWRVCCADDLWAGCADPDQLAQVLVHVAANARAAMPDGGSLTIDVDNAVIGVGRYVRLRMSDTGSGMPAEVVAKAFEPSFTTRGAGVGLGLAVVHGIVTGWGGEVRIDSEPGRGTCVTVLLPATAGVGATAGGAAAGSADLADLAGERGSGRVDELGGVEGLLQ